MDEQINWPLKKTKIVATIGPASHAPETLEALIKNGLNVARLNFAHGNFESHAETIANIRTAAALVDRRVAIMGDLPGPKMRIGHLATEPIELVQGQSFILQTEKIEGTSQRVCMSFDKLPEAVKPGDTIFINDGYIQLEVERVEDQEVHTRVVIGGPLRSFKGVNFPGIDLGIRAFTERDHECLRFAAEHKLDAVSQSFVQDAQDVKAVRRAAKALDYHPFIIAKIERKAALGNLDKILDVTDGIMVARGDLGVETPIEKTALLQKEIIRKANIMAKPVITATQMLESMVHNPRPTRAEATDVANAILDGTDCVMLSGETAMGEFPVQTVKIMSRIAKATESATSEHSHVFKALEARRQAGTLALKDAISLSNIESAKVLDPLVIVAPTKTGTTPRNLTRFRENTWVVALCVDEHVCQQLLFSYGVFPVHEPIIPPSWNQYCRSWLWEHGIKGGIAMLTEGSSVGHSQGDNRLEVIELH
jgi:pyruvate kinase